MLHRLLDAFSFFRSFLAILCVARLKGTQERGSKVVKSISYRWERRGSGHRHEARKRQSNNRAARGPFDRSSERRKCEIEMDVTWRLLLLSQMGSSSAPFFILCCEALASALANKLPHFQPFSGGPTLKKRPLTSISNRFRNKLRLFLRTSSSIFRLSSFFSSFLGRRLTESSQKAIGNAALYTCVCVARVLWGFLIYFQTSIQTPFLAGCALRAATSPA